MTLRQLVVRLDGLPEEAAVWDLEGWTSERRLQAMTVEMLDALRIQTAALTGDKKVKRMKPVELVPRPKKKNQSVKESYLGLVRNMRGG